MTCKDCLHYKVCELKRNHYYLGSPIGEIYEAELGCHNFTDSSEWVHIPCKVGEFCWFIRNNTIIKAPIEKIVLKEKGLYLKLSCNSLYETTCRSIGKTVFFTYEEAEKVLKEDCNENN